MAKKNKWKDWRECTFEEARVALIEGETVRMSTGEVFWKDPKKDIFYWSKSPENDGTFSIVPSLEMPLVLLCNKLYLYEKKEKKKEEKDADYPLQFIEAMAEFTRNNGVVRIECKKPHIVLGLWYNDLVDVSTNETPDLTAEHLLGRWRVMKW